jgi:hypothetical protein
MEFPTTDSTWNNIAWEIKIGDIEWEKRGGCMVRKQRKLRIPCKLEIKQSLLLKNNVYAC